MRQSGDECECKDGTPGSRGPPGLKGDAGKEGCKGDVGPRGDAEYCGPRGANLRICVNKDLKLSIAVHVYMHEGGDQTIIK